MNSSDIDSADLPEILTGPILRRASADRLVLWLVTRDGSPLGLELYLDAERDGARAPDIVFEPAEPARLLRIGEHAWVHCIDVAFGPETPYPLLPEDVPIGYDLVVGDKNGARATSAEVRALAYPGETRPRFLIRTRLTSLLHGSCRRPHHPSPDGLARADAWLAERRDTPEAWPTTLMLTGDQIYADDVAGPMLRAIHALIARLGLWDETINGAVVDDSDALYASPCCYYRRDQLLPRSEGNAALRERFFGGTRKPVFTAASAGNHLITLSEVLAMYLLSWSDVCWQIIDVTPPKLDEEERATYEDEARAISDFAAQLPQVQRVLAHLPTAMIFDDHDITDDWNLSAGWEATAYDHPFSRRIIGNALIGYFICQGWGNQPEVFDDIVLPRVMQFCSDADAARQDALIDTLLAFENWHYTLPTEPPLMVLDTRTRRWRPERKRWRPSGLMDWEALTEMQQGLMHQRAVVVVSPAPVFGVKLIENIQRVFTWFGKPLMVDAENWMAHRDAAYVLLNVFRHSRTPQNFTILSGDVHYSFAYDVTLRFGDVHQKIWQITSSGIKNEFPDTLLDWFDRLNRWLFAPYSPLNWFTKRRRMRIEPRRPRPRKRGERLVNRAGVGFVRFNTAGQPVEIRQLGADGVDSVFEPRDDRD